MFTKRVLAASAASALALFAVPMTASADDVSVTGNYTVAAGTTIDGNLTVRNGFVHIRGKVDGNVRQIGPGRVRVFARGAVDGNINETGAGEVRVDGTVDGNVSERGLGSLFITRKGRVDGNALERGRGGIAINGYLDGNAEEWDIGSIVIGGYVDGNAIERSIGDIVIRRGGTLKGDAEENGPGRVIRNR